MFGMVIERVSRPRALMFPATWDDGCGSPTTIQHAPTVAALAGAAVPPTKAPTNMVAASEAATVLFIFIAMCHGTTGRFQVIPR